MIFQLLSNSSVDLDNEPSLYLVENNKTIIAIRHCDILVLSSLEKISKIFTSSFIKYIEKKSLNSIYLLDEKHFEIIIDKTKYKLSDIIKMNVKIDILTELETIKYDMKKVIPKDLILFISGYLFEEIVDKYNTWFLNHNHEINLLIAINDENLAQMYKFNENNQICSGENCGINLLIPYDIEVPGNARSFPIDYCLNAEANPSRGYFLMPRSSIAKNSDETLRQSNSIGLIEPSYRGNLIAKIDNLSENKKIKKKGESITQLVMHNLRTNWKMQRVLKLSKTQRGIGGFGSTGK